MIRRASSDTPSEMAAARSSSCEAGAAPGSRPDAVGSIVREGVRLLDRGRRQGVTLFVGARCGALRPAGSTPRPRVRGLRPVAAGIRRRGSRSAPTPEWIERHRGSDPVFRRGDSSISGDAILQRCDEVARGHRRRQRQGERRDRPAHHPRVRPGRRGGRRRWESAGAGFSAADRPRFAGPPGGGFDRLTGGGCLVATGGGFSGTTGGGLLFQLVAAFPVRLAWVSGPADAGAPPPPRGHPATCR